MDFLNFFIKPSPEPFVPEEASFPTPSSPPPPRPPDPLPAQEASSSPSRHNMGPGSGSMSDPFSPSTGSCVTEQGLLGNVLSLCEDLSGGAEPLSPWAGEGAYCRAPGFEREDQVRGAEHGHYGLLLNGKLWMNSYIIHRGLSCMFSCHHSFVFSG